MATSEEVADLYAGMDLREVLLMAIADTINTARCARCRPGRSMWPGCCRRSGISTSGSPAGSASSRSRRWSIGSACSGSSSDRGAGGDAAHAVHRHQPDPVPPRHRACWRSTISPAPSDLAGARRRDPGADLGRYRQAPLHHHRHGRRSCCSCRWRSPRTMPRSAGSGRGGAGCTGWSIRRWLLGAVHFVMLRKGWQVEPLVYLGARRRCSWPCA